MSRAPIRSGQRKLLNPESTGEAYQKIMVTPCMVNSWLYCSGVSRRSLLWASWSRMTAASSPPSTRNTKAVTR